MGLLRSLVDLLRGELRPERASHEAISSARNLSIRSGSYVTADDLERKRRELGRIFPKDRGRTDGQDDLRRPE